MDKRPIGVFDSGLGGLTSVRELRRLLPGEDIVYFGDTGRVPYGNRGSEVIRQYARQDIAFLRGRGVKLILAACGTVSSTYPPGEASGLPLPYLGVVEPTARAAAAATRTGRIGIIGTAATIRSGSYERLLHALQPGVSTVARACPLFVPLVENGHVAPNDAVCSLVAEEYLAPLRGAGVDTLILGCTHYPLLAGVIGRVMGPGVELIDAGREAARAVKARLAADGLLNETGGSVRYYVTDSTDQFAAMADLCLDGGPHGPVEHVPIERIAALETAFDGPGGFVERKGRA